MSQVNFNMILGNGNVGLGNSGMPYSYNPLLGGNPFGGCGCGCEGGFGNLFGGFGNSFGSFGNFGSFGGFNSFGNFGGCNSFGGGYSTGFEMGTNPMGGFSMGGYSSYSNPMMGGCSCFGNGFGMQAPMYSRSLDKTMTTLFGISEIGMGISNISNALSNNG